MTDLFTAIGNFGFPIAITIYLLLRFEKKLETLTDVMRDNTDVTKKLANAVTNLRKKVK